MGKQLSKQERRQQLLEAALKSFGERGYHDTQVSHIIAEAKVARGTFYLYFESKKEIFDEIITDISDRVQKVIKPIKKDKLLEIPPQILGNIERATRLLLKNPLYIKIFFSDAVGLNKEFDERLRKFYNYVLASIREGLDQGQGLGFIRKGNTYLLALCMMGTLKEIFYQYVLAPTARNRKKSSGRSTAWSSTPSFSRT